MINKLLIVLFPLFFLSCSNYEKGSSIVGEWDLYSNKYILSDNLVGVSPDGSIPVSGRASYTKNNPPLLYGSIKKKINVKKGENYTLYISGILSSSKVWIDNTLSGEFGTIGYSKEESNPFIKRALINFVPDNDECEIVIEFSNFRLQSKWLFKWIVYGKSSDITDLYIRNQSKDYFATGMLIMCTTLFFLMFLVNRSNWYNLYFSLFTLSYGIRSYLMKNTTIQHFIPRFNWVLEYQFNKASELWALAFIILFLKSLYPYEFRGKFSKGITLTAFLSSLLSFVPIDLFYKYHFLSLMHIIIVVSGIYIISRLVLATKAKEPFAVFALLSIILFFISIIFDMIANSIMIAFDYYSAQVVIIVVAVMFLMIGRKRHDSLLFITEKQQSNKNIKEIFSRFVPIEILDNLNNSDLEERPPGEYALKPLTVAYIDIRDFTSLSEGLTPLENFSLINNFYEIVGSEVKKHDGYIESYGGDGVKAIFPCAPDKAIDASLNISKRVMATSGIKIGMSINFGQVVLGTVGGDNRIQATAISSVTRFLNSMDSFNSSMAIELIITDKVYALSSLDNSRVIKLGSMLLRGEEDEITLYQVETPSFKIDPFFKEAFESGVMMLEYKKYSKAYGYFKLAQEYNKDHRLASYYISELEIFFKLRGLTFTLRV